MSRITTIIICGLILILISCSPEQNAVVVLPTLAILPTLTPTSTATYSPTPTFSPVPSFTFTPSQTLKPASVPTMTPVKFVTMPPQFTLAPFQIAMMQTRTAIYSQDNNRSAADRTVAYSIIVDQLSIPRVWGGGDATVEFKRGFLHFIFYYDTRPIYPGYTSDTEGVLAEATSKMPDTVCKLREAGFDQWTISAEFRIKVSDDGGTGNGWCISKSMLKELNCDAPKANLIWSTPVPSFACTLNG